MGIAIEDGISDEIEFSKLCKMEAKSVETVK
jgi:hypothetical protein